MSAVFLVFLLLHVVHALLVNRRRVIHDKDVSIRAAVATQTPAFLLACYFGYETGVLGRAVVAPWWIATGLVGGHIVFCISLLTTHGSIRDAGTMLKDVNGLWDYTVNHPEVLFRFLGVGIAEEIIWRVGAQPILTEVTGYASVGIVLAAVGFAVVHKHFFTNPPLVSVEFLAFALVLGILFYVTQSFTLVMLIHAVRDIEIAYLEHVIATKHPDSEEQLPAQADSVSAAWAHRTTNRDHAIAA